MSAKNGHRKTSSITPSALSSGASGTPGRHGDRMAEVTPSVPSARQVKMYGKPDSLIRACKALQASAANTAPDISIQAQHLAAILEKGQETDDNEQGITKMKDIITNIEVYIGRVDPQDVEQKQRVANIQNQLEMTAKGIERRGDLATLDYFANLGKKSPCTEAMNALSFQSRELRDLVCPDLAEVAGNYANFRKAKIDVYHGQGTTHVFAKNRGRQRCLFEGAEITANGHVAACNDAIGDGAWSDSEDEEAGESKKPQVVSKKETIGFFSFAKGRRI